MPKVTPGKTRKKRSRRRRAAVTTTPANGLGHPYVMDGDRPTHVLVPIEEYARLTRSSLVEDAVLKLEDETVGWVDADAFGLRLAGERIGEARRAKGLTQKQLGEKLGLPQSQISRIERNPDRTTVRTLRRIARALRVDLGALL